jgi:predicted nuclease of predicted toxin-antitoxin system
MIRILADENFDGRIIRGVLREYPDADILRAQDTEIYQATDPEVLEWAAQEGRVVLTHDVQTMIGYADERIKQGLPMPGVIVVRKSLPIGRAVDDLLAVVGASDMSDWDNIVSRLPL